MISSQQCEERGVDTDNRLEMTQRQQGILMVTSESGLILLRYEIKSDSDELTIHGSKDTLSRVIGQASAHVPNAQLYTRERLVEVYYDRIPLRELALRGESSQLEDGPAWAKYLQYEPPGGLSHSGTRGGDTNHTGYVRCVQRNPQWYHCKRTTRSKV